MPRKFRLILCGVVIVAAAICLVWLRLKSSPERLLHQARLELARRNLERAESLAQRVADSGSTSAPWGAIVAAEAALKQGSYERALDYYRRVPLGRGEAALSAQFGAAEAEAHLGRLSESEKSLRELLEYDPSHLLAHYRLAFILNITGRRWEAGSHLLFLLKANAAEFDHLLLLGNTERTVEEERLLTESRERAPDDPLPLLGAARLELTLSRPAEARRLLSQIGDRLPREPELAVRWGQLLLDSGTRDEFLEWNAKLAPDAETHPDIWLLRGLFWQKESRPQWAARCFWEALKRDPESRHANYQLGQVLSRLNDPRATPFLRRADQLLGLTLLLDDLFYTRSHLDSMYQAARVTEHMGRLWEARSWAMAALKIDRDVQWASEILQRLPQLDPDLPQTLPEKNLALINDFSQFQLPDWPAPQKQRSELQSRESVTHIHFRDDSSLLDGDFIYFQSPDAATPGARIFETTGGGVAAFDYDNDLWPDLYFTQGSEFPQVTPDSETERSPYRDRLQRNSEGRRFHDVTTASHLGDERFSQGVAAGDFNNDGFQDLYVANLGRNRLYQNQGDGTFRDVTDEAGIGGDWWTTSCLVADLNGDSLPDIYDVNYVAGDNLATLMCEKQGHPRSCSPRAFAAAPDQIWLNLGDGRFRDATDSSGIELPSGYGLGIIAANFADNGLLSLFVANDEVPNFFLVNRSSPTQQQFQFEDLGLPSGLGVDGEGASQACMGVAAGDADGDGLLDLFVTNFYNESNTLYHQTGPLQFTDETRRARLRDPSFAMLGFGTQFLDADLDGWQDLIVANGHIDDLTDVGQPYQMPLQFFHNAGQGVFDELPASRAGSLFEKKSLGRGLTRLDWNRDGREDFCVSQIADRALLATNDSPSKGSFITLHLVGRTRDRDAIGARVEIQLAGRTLVRELVAGDGYHASNERRITFGVGASDVVKSLSVTWLNGAHQKWSQVPANQSLLIIEGNERLWSCH